MKKIYTYLQLGLWLIIAMAIPHLGFAQTCDVTPMNISKIATDWTTNCARVATDACDPTNGPICDGTPSSNWLLLNPNDYCLPKAPCNAVGFSKVEVTMTMEGTWRVKNIGNLSQNTSVGLLGCIKAWMCDLLFDPLEPSAFTGIITLAAGEEKNGLLPTRTKTSAYPGDLDALFAKNCSDKVCIEGLADGFTTLTISNGNLQAITTVFASLKACVNYKKFDWSVTGSEAACETSADGKVFVNFTPATGTNASDYEIRVGNGGTWTVAQAAVSGANTISGLPAGSYTVAVVYKPLANTVIPSDSETCGYCKSSVTIASATATLSCSSDPDCPGGSADGSVTVGVTGNNLGTVSYNWGGGNTNATLSGLTPGNYTVTVTYGPNGKCSKTTTCTVVAAPGVDADVTFTNVKCNGAADGTITVDPTSGTANYTIAVTGKPNQNSNGVARTFTGFGPGTYTVTVTDANGCLFTEMVTIAEPNPVTITCASVNTSCKGLSDGKIRVTSVTSDVGGPYKVSVDQIAGGNNDIAESVQTIPYEATVGTGTYVITVKDKNDCIARCTTIVKDGFTPAINCVITQIACFGGKGTITATASGKDADGNPVASTFDYVLSGSASASNTTGIFTGLSAGTYTVTATKTGNVGCSVACTGNIIVEPAQLSCTITGNNSVCRNEKITFTGPAGMTNYVWTVTGATFTGQGTVSIEVTAPASGSFEVKLKTQKTSTVDNTTLCESGECTKTVNVTVPTCPVIAPKTVCAGSQNVEYDAGSGYTNIVWSTSDSKISIASGQGTHKVRFNVASTAVGPYTITFTAKQNGCPVTCTYTLTVDPLPSVVLTPEQPVCRNPPTGKIAVVASGGTQPYVFIIRQGSPMGTIITPTITNQTATGLTYNGLAPGTYYVEVIDKAGVGCSSDPAVQILTVQNPLDFTLTLDCTNQVAGNVAVNLTNITGGATAPNGHEYQVNGTAGTWLAVVNPILLPVNSGNYTIYLREKGVNTGCDPASKVINTTCCKLDGVCKLTTPAPLTGCDLSGVPGPKTNPTDVFSGVTFCTEARIQVTTTNGGSLCGGGLTRTYTYVLYDDVIDNNIFDTGEPFITGTCAETYTVTPPPVVINCPANDLTIPACTSADAAQTLLNNYKAQFSFTGGCNAVPSFSAVVLPNPCTGGTVSLTYTVTSDCDTKTCTKSIIRTVNPSITLNCADNVNITTCKTQNQVNAEFNNWLSQFSVTGGCNATGSFDGTPTAPLACGGTTTVTYRVVDPFGCNTQTCTKTFTVTPPPLVINCPANNLTIPACTSAGAAQTLLDNYKAQFSFTGGCNAVPSFSAVVLPNPCTGGTVSITYTVTSDCDTKTCTKSIIRTVNPSITLNCADNVNITTCKTQTEIDNEFEDWLSDFSVSGGCDATGRFDGEPIAPLTCGGTTSVTYRVVDPFGCNTQTCTKTFTVTPPALVINCPANNLTIPACTTAEAAQTLLDNYKAQFSFTGGCNAVPSFSAVVLPNPCTGGTVSITYTVTSDCDTKTCTKSIIRTVNPSITLNCADNVAITTCKTKDQVNTEFNNWLSQFSVTGGCNATGKFDGEPEAPLACGGTTTVTYRVVDPFGCNTQTCTKTFTVTPPALVINCPANNLTIPACTSADAAQTLLNNYKAQFSFTGGCNAVPSFSAVVLPNPCTGGTVSITYTVTSDCDTKSCTKSIIRTVNPSITLNCADNVTITTCKTQDQVNTEFDNWLSQFSVTGGCNATGRFDGEPEAPLACGGTTTVTYRVVDPFGCNTQTCTKTFTVTPPALVINCPANNLTIPACTSADAAQTLLNNYKTQFSFTGGCNAVPSFSAVVLPNPCTGGTVSITYTVTSDCDTKTCTKSIIRTVNPSITLNCADNVNITTCKTQDQVNTEFDNWLSQFSVTGGCNATGKFDGEPEAPLACGGTTTVTYRVVDAFGCNTQTCTKTFTITPPDFNLSVPETGLNIPACTSNADAQTLLNNYKALFSFSGGCNSAANFSPITLPDYCTGGSVTLTYSFTSDCGTRTITRTITRAAEPTLSISCPETDLVIPACLTEVEAQKYVDDYKKLFSYSGGCNPQITFSAVTLPNVCTGGETTITYTVTSDCAQKTCTKKITRIANPIPTVNISVDKSKFCEVGDAQVVMSIPGNKASYDIYYNDLITKVNESCNPVAVGGTYIVEDDLDGEFVLDLKQLTAGTYQYTVEKVVDPFGCASVPDVSDVVSITVYPKPVGESRNKTIDNCNKVNVDLQSQIKCNVLSTFKWYSVQSEGSSIPYNNPNVDGETVNPSGTGPVINDILSNLTKVNQTIIYRVVPTSVTGVCEGEPFFITVTIRPATKVECLACMTEVNVSLDANCRFEVLPNHVIDFDRCENGRVLRDALEVVISGTNASNIITCAGTYTYVVKLKEEYEKCFLFDPCWGKITAEDKTAPALVCAPADITLDCYDVNYVLNNRLTIGNVGATSSPRPAASGSQIINNAEGVAGTGDNCQLGLAPPALVSDVIKNLGYAYFKDNCYNCGCRITLKWSDKVVFYSCEDMKTNGGIYATISREWVATDCNGMRSDYTQKINFTRPAIDLLAGANDRGLRFRGNGTTGANADVPAPNYDWVVQYTSCTPDKSLIKKADVTPSFCSYFNTSNNPRCLYLDEVECNYSVQIKDTEFPICNGKGLKIDREIYVFDWCAGGIVDTFHVLIKIGDFEAPTYEYAHGAPFDISTGPMDCTAAIPVTVAGIKSAFGVTIKDNCTLGNVSVSVYTKDRYVKGILVYQGPADPLCDDDRVRGGELRGDNDAYRLGSCNKEDICWEKVEYAVMNGMMIGLPVGKHLMVIDAFDGCYNASTACFVFEVKDKIAPIMKCDDDLHVTLSNANGYTNGYAQVSAEDIDEGSWDNCKLAWIAVRRNVPDGCAASFIAKGYDTNGNGKLDALPADGDVSKADGFDLNGDGDIADFGETFILKGGKLMTPLLDYVEFFCCDLTERVTVELWGGDIYGNTNYCWMDLLIEDKVAPTCLAPWDVTIYCDDKNIGQIDNKLASAKIFGDVTIPSGNDCAALDTTYTTEKKLKCGYGWIDRIWTLTKQTVKGPISVTCKQRIHILPVHEYNICFPKDISTDCKTPIIDTVITDELGCDILAVNVHDKRYDASNDECYKIFRTYSVINWCTYDDRCGDPLEQTNISIIDRAVFGNYGKAPIYVLVRDREDNRRDGVEEFYISKDLIHNNADDIRFKPKYCEVAGEFIHSFIYTQIIKVYDDTRPVVTGVRDTFCTSPTACTANITKVVTIKDNCTDKVELERQQLMIAPFQTLDAGKMITYSTPRWSTKDLGNGQYEITVSNLPEGTHDLIVVGRDECGNLSVATRIPFVVKDCKAPAPICINGLSTELMPDGNNGGMMAVWASDFVASKIYDCNGQGPETKDGLKLVTKYSINRVGEPVVATQTGLNLTCADAGKVILVELHAWDEAGNHDFCVTFVEVQDNRKVCPDPSNIVTGEISGLVATDEAEPVSGVKIDVSGGAQMNQNTPSNGLFNFGKLPLGSDFTLAAQLDKDHLNGVSTFDLVQLQKHILGVQTIKNPYRLIAADVNNSKSISTLDMIQMRKLILNIDDRFSNVPSWRFVDAAYKFPDPNNPWIEAFPEVVNVNDLAGKVQANFIAIKMGDINGNAQVSSTASAEVRSTKALQLQTEEQELKAGQHYAISIRAKDLASVQGFQFTLQVDPSMAQLENIEYNGVMKADHFGYFPRSGQITSSYVGAPLAGAPLSSTTAESVLFTLHLKAEANLPLSKVLKINSQLTPKEAYDKNDELMDVQLELKGATLSDLAALYQNTPNPFVEETAIGFYLPKASAATLTVRDVKGALLYRLEGNYAKGENQIILKQEQLRSSGVLYYTLETADFTASKKMILLNK